MSGPASAPAKRLLLLVDTSASMRRADLWADAQKKVAFLVRQASPVDQVALFTFDREVTSRVSFEQWNGTPAGDRGALVIGTLANISPGWSATQLGHALTSAAETLTDASGKTGSAAGQIAVISDFQEGSRLESLQGYEWPKGVTLVIERLTPKHLGNASLHLVTGSDTGDPKKIEGLRVRVGNSADSRREEFKIGWAGSAGGGIVGAPTSVYVPPGQSRVVLVPLAPEAGKLDRIVLQGDDDDFDNTVYAIPPETSQLKVIYFGEESEQDAKQPLYFLQRAFQETQRRSVQVIPKPVTGPFPAAETLAASLSVVGGPIPEAAARVLHDQAAEGKTILFVSRNPGNAPTLSRMLGLERLAVEEARSGNYAMLAEIDFRHPVFAPFADPRFSDFTKIHFWRYRRLDAGAIPGARILAKFDDGNPALLEAPVGKGRVLVLTSGWHPEDSQLALSTKFVPLLYSLLEYGGAPEPAPVQHLVGDVVALRQDARASGSTPAVTLPDGTQVRLSAQETNFSQTLTPGIYTVAALESGKPSRFAVNLDPMESRTVPLAVDELERLGAPVSQPAESLAREADRKIRLHNAELENRQKLWHWFLLGTLGILLLETWLAGRAVRPLAGKREAAI